MLVGEQGDSAPDQTEKPNQTKSQPIRSMAHYSMVGEASTAEGAAKQIYTRYVNGGPA